MNAHRQIAFIAAVMIAACAKKPEPRLPIRVLTTPGIAATGIVAQLGSAFGLQSGARIDVVPLDPAAVVGHAKRGTADVVITDDPATIAALGAAHLVRISSTVASDEYFIAGPSRNPAHLHRSDDAPKAFLKIFARRRAFCSLVDVASIHEREQQIWSAAKLKPEKNPHYEKCRGNAATAIEKASRAGAYVLVDRATFDRVNPPHMAALVRGGALLANDLTVLLIERRGRSKDADWFVEWMMSFRGIDAIDAYRVDGHRVFYTQR
jgi:tungstate transport system substrate-binding protein